MDNLRILITAEGDDSLGKAIELAFAHNCPGNKANHYRTRKLLPKTRYFGEPPSQTHATEFVDDPVGTPTLILYWEAEKEAQLLPYALDVDEAKAFIRGWLKMADYGPEPSHDGDNGRGWTVFVEDWGHVAGSSCAVCAVQPAWALYGK